jgi:hypothetical protein
VLANHGRQNNETEMKTITTIEEASMLLGQPIKTEFNGFQHIVWTTESHSYEVQNAKRYDGTPFLLVRADPLRHWAFGSEVRRRRPRKVWVENPSERYIQTLAAKAINFKQ